MSRGYPYWLSSQSSSATFAPCPTDRTYGDRCGIARALDVVGERWALLVVRELLLGPQRFSDLRRALPRASSNMVADRLRELEGHGVVARRTLPPPAGSARLRAHAVGPRARARGARARRLGHPSAAAAGAADAQPDLGPALPARRRADRSRCAAPAEHRFELGRSVWTVRTQDGEVRVEPREPTAPDATLRTDPLTLNDVLGDPPVARRGGDGRARRAGRRRPRAAPAAAVGQLIEKPRRSGAFP